jgi:uncharacterized protein YbgA (DUF1722 family)/uncharacterized protein YbbK (DUF523 family)
MGTANNHKIPVGISSCLLGEKVRYDGAHKYHSYIVSTLGEYFEYRSFCPEMSIGLGVPRKPIRLVAMDNEVHCVGVEDPSFDVTQKLVSCATEQHKWHQQIYAHIVKKDSPSCGMERVKVYTNNHPTRSGSGFYTKTLMQNFPNLPIEEEGRLEDPVLRENFIKRVFIYKRWHDMADNSLDLKHLTCFHAQHKLILYSHNQSQARKLGKKLSDIRKENVKRFSEEYISTLMQILKLPATTKNHVNVLQHIQGYLKKRLDTKDKAELTQIIEEYRLGLVPLITPITLLRHHFRNNPDPYIEASYYMHPHPKELMLLNHL